MAATAAYVNITRVPHSSIPGETVRFDNISATTAGFKLTGGRYGVTIKASTYGSVTIQILAEDNTTWLTAMPAVTADGTAVGDFPEGMYRVALA